MVELSLPAFNKEKVKAYHKRLVQLLTEHTLTSTEQITQSHFGDLFNSFKDYKLPSEFDNCTELSVVAEELNKTTDYSSLKGLTFSELELKLDNYYFKELLILYPDVKDWYSEALYYLAFIYALPSALQHSLGLLDLDDECTMYKKSFYELLVVLLYGNNNEEESVFVKEAATVVYTEVSTLWGLSLELVKNVLEEEGLKVSKDFTVEDCTACASLLVNTAHIDYKQQGEMAYRINLKLNYMFTLNLIQKPFVE